MASGSLLSLALAPLLHAGEAEVGLAGGVVVLALLAVFVLATAIVFARYQR